VQPGDPDPLPNTASVTCTVDGFGNVIGPVDASHSVNLFQPSVVVDKSGPDIALVGQTITYSFTITNTSSGDTPTLLLVSVSDNVLGDLTGVAAAAGCGALNPGAVCGFSFNYTIPSVVPSPLVNVVTVHYNPDGFPNDITDSDDHSLLVPQEGCTPGFWQGGLALPYGIRPTILTGRPMAARVRTRSSTPRCSTTSSRLTHRPPV
jgi:uncharacterized repeat protein (TIGR01451 family)